MMKKSQDDMNILLGRRIRFLRNLKGWTQQELGNQADINYKFIGEIERGQQNPSFKVLVKIATSLEVELPELFRFEHQIFDRKEIEARIKEILKGIPDDQLRQILMLMQVLYPIH
jgi:transcriptional regulator with XRE-family HTH domain